jgi:hypothetical protein
VKKRLTSFSIFIAALIFLSANAAYASPEANPLPQNCSTACIAPYGEVLGATLDGTRAYSNCKADCVIFEPNREHDVYSGIKWQCVEFARRWLIRNRGLTFGDVDIAADIWAIDSFTRLSDGSKVPVENQLNGASALPRKGDLLIYAKEYLSTGHAAVVLEVDTAKGTIKVGEENYENQKWPANYSRRIEFITRHGRYWVLDAYLLGWKHLP